MLRIKPGENYGKKHYLHSLRLLCLLCILFSFCFVFTYTESGISLSTATGHEYIINSAISNPALLQFNCRFSPFNLMEGIRHKKTSLVALSSVHSGISANAPGENSFSHMLLGPNGSFRVNFKFTYLLLDLPPPSI
jgi:hypothetical protein